MKEHRESEAQRKALSSSQMGGYTFTHSLVRKGTTGPHRVVLRPRVNNQGLWEAGFVASGGWSASWLQQEGVIGLSELFHRLAEN